MGTPTVPVVLLGRYTTLAGPDPFATSPIVVAEYSRIELGVWRGPMEDPLGTFEFKLEESMDRVTWTNVATSSIPSATETAVAADLSRTWLRVSARMTAADFPVASCYAVGFLVRRRG